MDLFRSTGKLIRKVSRWAEQFEEVVVFKPNRQPLKMFDTLYMRNKQGYFVHTGVIYEDKAEFERVYWDMKKQAIHYTSEFTAFSQKQIYLHGEVIE